MPGMLSVVACGRTRGVWLPEFCLSGGLVSLATVAQRVDEGSAETGIILKRPRGSAYIRGDVGAVEDRLRE
jgi:hypothetical protein